MKNKKEKKLKIGIIIGLVLIFSIILLIILLKTYNSSNAKKSEQQLKYIMSDEWNDELFPKGMPAFIRSYSGELNAKNIGKSIDYVVNTVIPQYKKDLYGKDEKEITKYYNKNKNAIIIDTGIDNIDDFKKFINEIVIKTKSNDLKFESFYIDENSIEEYSNKTTAYLYIEYDGCAEVDLKIEALKNIEKQISSVKYFAK